MTLSKTRSIDFRVNTCPTVYGEKVVLRILDRPPAHTGRRVAGFRDDQKETFLDGHQQALRHDPGDRADR